jgi:proline iminopeptidase
MEGHGPTCLVLGSSIYYPRAFSQGLREHLRLVFADLRHFGTSDTSFGPDRITVETYAEDIEQIRQTLSLGKVIVIGHSFHATFALDYALRYPEHVRGVVWLGASPRVDPAEEDRLWADASLERKELDARKRAELTPELRATLSPSDLFIREYLVNEPRFWYDHDLDTSWMWDDVVADPPVWDRVGDLFEDDDGAEGAAKVTVPMLVAVGRYDYNNPHTLWRGDGDEERSYSFVLFERSGHGPMFEEPERFDQALLEWVGGLPSD